MSRATLQFSDPPSPNPSGPQDAFESRETPSSWLEIGATPEQADLMAAAGLPTPNPLQARAARHLPLLQGASCAVLAPTATGKTGVGLLACVRAITAGRMAVILVPTRALAAEIHQRLAAAWGASPHPCHARNVAVALTTGEIALDDPAIRAGGVDLVVAVYEKFRALALQQPALLASLGCVVADEIRILSDPQRGAAADGLLAAIISLDHQPQIVALGSPHDDRDAISQWLHGECLVHDNRPGTLREGTLCLADGWYCYRQAHGNGEIGVERLLPVPSPMSNRPGAVASAALHAAAHLARQAVELRSNIIIFVPTRRVAREWACYLAAAMAEAGHHDAPLPPSYQPLLDGEPGHARRLLVDCAANGVAFHSGDLTDQQRAAVEQAFRDGSIRCLVSTPTLAEGVNFDCGQVLVVPAEVAEVAAAAAPLDSCRFANMAGRAGRFPASATSANQPRSIILVADREHASQAWNTLLSPAAPPTRALAASRIDDMALAFVGLAPGASRDRLLHLFRLTFHATALASDPSASSHLLNEALQRLESYGMVEFQANQPRLTPLGSVACHHGLPPSPVCWLASIVSEWPAPSQPQPQPGDATAPCRSADLALLLLAALALPPGEAHLPAPAPGSSRARDVQARLREWLPAEIPALSSFTQSRHDLPAEELAAALTAMAASDWVDGQELATLESRYRILGGALSALAARIANVLSATDAIASHVENPAFPAEACKQLVLRLPKGLPAIAAGLAEFVPSPLDRMQAVELSRAGFDSPEALNNTAQHWSRLLPPATAQIFQETLRRRDAALLAHPGATPADYSLASPTPAEEPQPHQTYPASTARRHQRRPNPAHRPATALECDHLPQHCELALDPANPGTARVRGSCVQLSPLTFQLLALLASRAGRIVPYLAIRQTLWPGARVGDQQVRFHKRRLAQALSRAGAADWLETRHGHGLRLKVAPEQTWVGADTPRDVAALS